MQEYISWTSWTTPKELREVPSAGSPAPDVPSLDLPKDGRPVVLAFLRHAGCPFAEKTYLDLREVAKEHRDIDFMAVSHSSGTATSTWLKSLPQAGSKPGNLRTVVDAESYAAFGLGPSSFAHVLSPAGLYEVWRLGQQEGIWNRPTESGSRWQTSGFFAIDSEGIVRWGRAARRADDIPDFEDAVEAVEQGSRKS